MHNLPHRKNIKYRTRTSKLLTLMASIILQYWRFHTNILVFKPWSRTADPCHSKVSQEPECNGNNGTDHFLSTSADSLPRVWRVNRKNTRGSDDKIRVKVNNLKQMWSTEFPWHIQISVTFCVQLPETDRSLTTTITSRHRVISQALIFTFHFHFVHPFWDKCFESLIYSIPRVILT
jgi:hypothetical protein